MIVYDLQAVQSIGNSERGIARYVGEVAAALQRRGDGIVDVFAWNDRLPFVPRLDALGLGDRLRSFSELRGARVDVLHIGSPFELMPLDRFLAPVSAERTVMTCYDLIPYRFPEHYLRDPAERARYQARLSMLLGADEIVTDSESAAADVVAMLGYPAERLTSLGAGVSEQFVPPTASLGERMSALRRTIPDLLPGFVLVPTGMDWRKNTIGAIEAFSRLPEDVREHHQLLIACRVTDDQRAGLERRCEALGCAEQVIFSGLVSDEDLVRLYQTAELVFFPSFYEGFGLPVLEARRCGARVICSEVSSLPEVLPDAEAMFNPYDIDEMTAMLHRALCDVEFAARLDRVPDAGFSWDLAADRLASVYRRVAARIEVARSRVEAAGGASPTDRQVRIGVATVLPPTRGGTNSSARLLTGLCVDADVTAFVETNASGQQGRWPFEVEPLSVLPSRLAAGDLDAVLYHLGGEDPGALLAMLHRVPGHLLIGAVDDDGRILVDADHGAATGRDVMDRDVTDHVRDRSTERRVPLRDVLHGAISVLVSDRRVADLVIEHGVPAVVVGPIEQSDPSDAVSERDGARLVRVALVGGQPAPA